MRLFWGHLWLVLWPMKNAAHSYAGPIEVPELPEYWWAQPRKAGRSPGYGHLFNSGQRSKSMAFIPSPKLLLVSLIWPMTPPGWKYLTCLINDLISIFEFLTPNPDSFKSVSTHLPSLLQNHAWPMDGTTGAHSETNRDCGANEDYQDKNGMYNVLVLWPLLHRNRHFSQSPSKHKHLEPTDELSTLLPRSK